MKDPLDLTADELLRLTEPWYLFKGATPTMPPTEDQIKQIYRRLAVKWHPDKYIIGKAKAKASAVFAHLGQLHIKAMKMLDGGDWKVPGLLLLKSKDNRERDFQYYSMRTFELGLMYVGDTEVVYLIDHHNADLFMNARRTVVALKYSNPDMEKEVSRYLPKIKEVFETADWLVMVISKTPDMLLLADVLDHCDGVIGSRHSAWIVSRLYGLACYFQHTGLTHNAISVESCFISPQYHTVSLLGGWWYSVPLGKKLLALPGTTVEYCPPDALREKQGDSRIDLELTRMVGRSLLGDASGAKLHLNTEAPQPMVEWLKHPSNGNALRDYQHWTDKVLVASFGPKKFIPFDLTAKDLYVIN